MRAAIFRNGQIVVDTLPEPKPAAGQVLVKSLACGICGSDLHARQHAHRMVELAKHFPGRKPMDLSRDIVFGHEFCCEVLDYGPGTTAKIQAGHKGVLAAGADHGGRPAGHRLFQRQCRRLCRAHAAQRSPVAGSAERTCGGARGIDRAAGRRRSCGGKSQYPRRRGAAGDRLRPGRSRRDRGAEDQGAGPDRGGGLFAEAARAGRKARRRHRGRSRALAAVRDLGRARPDDAGAEGRAAAAAGACCRR